jgi:hypothetical protein
MREFQRISRSMYVDIWASCEGERTTGSSLGLEPDWEGQESDRKGSSNSAMRASSMGISIVLLARSRNQIGARADSAFWRSRAGRALSRSSR